MSEWKTIESAPASKNVWAWDGQEAFEAWTNNGQHWYGISQQWGGGLRRTTPLLWHPLPAPPTTEETKEK